MYDIRIFAKIEKELDTLTLTIIIYRQDRGIEFSSDKYDLLIIKSGKRQITEGTEQERIGKNKSYECLRILEADTIKRAEII